MPAATNRIPNHRRERNQLKPHTLSDWTDLLSPVNTLDKTKSQLQSEWNKVITVLQSSIRNGKLVSNVWEQIPDAYNPNM
jgi:hypothetical protein